MSKDQEEIVRRVIGAVEDLLEQEMGISVSLERTKKRKGTRTSYEVLSIMDSVAQTMHMTMDDYFIGRQTRYVDLRRVAMKLIMTYCPGTTQREIAEAMGIHHTSVIYHLNAVEKLFNDEAEPFMSKYKQAEKNVPDEIKAKKDAI